MSKISRERHKVRTEYFEYLKETAKVVDPYVNQFIQNNYNANSELGEKLIARYRFGKAQLRPAQVRLAYELVEGDDWNKSIPACASVEAKDTGYYCLDDVLDSGANPVLILLEGIFSSASYAMLNDLFAYFPAEQVQKVIKELSNLDSNNAKGALIDINLKQPNEELYLQKAKGYNFLEHALRIGAILGNASSREVEKIGLAGQNIGIGYIIANDTWDFGKELEDFKDGKYTLPIMFAFENATEQDKRELVSLFNQKNISPEQIDKVRKIVVRNGTIKYGMEKSQEFCNKGIEVLNQFPDSKARRLLEFATTMTQRNKFYDILKKYK